MNPQLNTSLVKTWKEQIRQVARHNPRLAHELWQNRQVYFDRFAHFYRQLANLPRKFRRKFLRRLATTLAGAALLLALGQALPARAAVITVDGVTCTLAEAITSANNDNAAGNGCVDGNGADMIDLQTDVLLTAYLPAITSEIALEGNGHTLDGNDSFRVLELQATGDLTMNDTTIVDGFTGGGGGGIENNGGTLTVNNSTLSGNSANNGGGGIANYNGTVTVNNSTLSGNSGGSSALNGGGITNSGILTVNGSTLSGNSGGGITNKSSGTLELNNSILNGNTGSGITNIGGAVTVNNSTLSGNSSGGSGGAIHNGYLSGTVTLNNSTLSGNTAGSFGGGIVNSSGTIMLNSSTLIGNSAFGTYGGGGIFNNSGTLIVNNSTLSGNSAFGTHGGGGINNYFGTLEINNSTLSGNFANNEGGGIINSGILTLTRSLISGNQATASGPEVYNLNTVNANNYNVVGYGGSARSFGFTPGANDLIPPGALDTVLDTTLADNGGPTLTHALVSGSVAIDAAPDVACIAPPINGLDQRGYARNVDGDGTPSSNECDAGAFETELLPTPTPTMTPTATDTPTITPTPTVTPTPTNTSTPTNTLTPTHTSTPTPTGTFTSTPTDTLTPTNTSTPTPTGTFTSTPTNTPTPTETQSPGFKVYLPLVLRQDGTQAATPQSQTTNPLMNFVAIALLAMGNLIFFRHRRI